MKKIFQRVISFQLATITSLGMFMPVLAAPAKGKANPKPKPDEVPVTSLTGTWILKSGRVTINKKGCTPGATGVITLNGQDADTGAEITLAQNGNKLTISPQIIASGGSSHSQQGSGTVSGNHVTLMMSGTMPGASYSYEGTATISHDGNTVTGETNCKATSGPAVATGLGFSWTRKLPKPSGKAQCIENKVEWKSGPKAQNARLQGIQLLLDAINAAGVTSVEEQAYILATANWETGGFANIYENGDDKYFSKYEPGTPSGKNLGNTVAGDGKRFRGRGFSQVTGRWNYGHLTQRLQNDPVLKGHDFLKNPGELADPTISAQATVRGMIQGAFRNHKLDDYDYDGAFDYFDDYDYDGGFDYEGARNIINGDSVKKPKFPKKSNATKIAETARQIAEAISQCNGGQ